MPTTTDESFHFPFPTIDPIVGEPDYETIAELHKKINANAASVQSNLGNGRLGHLALTVSDAIYNTLSAIPFEPPANPGAQPEIPADATGPAAATIRHTFAESTTLFKKYVAVDMVLKQILLGAIDEMFIRALHTQYVGYLNVTTRDILNHLYTTYACISSADLLANDEKFKAPYDANLPIETLFTQIETSMEYAAAGNTPYTPAQIVANGFQIIFATGMFHDDCKIWNRKPAADKTWIPFKTFFARAHREFRDTRTTTTGAGYGSANAASYQQETVDAIANLATATAHDRATVATLSSTISKLTLELATANTKLITALATVTTLTNANSEHIRKQPNATPRTGARHYCWSCGFKCEHPSFRCTEQKPGHDTFAKAADTRNGSQANKA
jgi:hypothetical protein